MSAVESLAGVIDTLDVRCRVSSWQHSIPDHNIIFDALEGSAAVRKAKGALSLPAAGTVS